MTPSSATNTTTSSHLAWPISCLIHGGLASLLARIQANFRRGSKRKEEVEPLQDSNRLLFSVSCQRSPVGFSLTIRVNMVKIQPERYRARGHSWNLI